MPPVGTVEVVRLRPQYPPIHSAGDVRSSASAYTPVRTRPAAVSGATDEESAIDAESTRPKLEGTVFDPNRDGR